MNNIFDNVINVVVMASVVSVIMAVLINFIIDDKESHVKKGKRSLVATGTMFAFFGFYYIIIKLKLGVVRIDNYSTYQIILITGALMLVIGASINIAGRLRLKNNWANHIKIYENHSLVNTGVYRLVRHPLYASIMLMFFGGSLVNRNWLSLLLTAVIFIPFMYYRAKQEETLLNKEFVDYKVYAKKVGMFFPKCGGKRNGRV